MVEASTTQINTGQEENKGEEEKKEDGPQRGPDGKVSDFDCPPHTLSFILDHRN